MASTTPTLSWSVEVSRRSNASSAAVASTTSPAAAVSINRCLISSSLTRWMSRMSDIAVRRAEAWLCTSATFASATRRRSSSRCNAALARLRAPSVSTSAAMRFASPSCDVILSCARAVASISASRRPASLSAFASASCIAWWDAVNACCCAVSSAVPIAVATSSADNRPAMASRSAIALSRSVCIICSCFATSSTRFSFATASSPSLFLSPSSCLTRFLRLSTCCSARVLVSPAVVASPRSASTARDIRPASSSYRLARSSASSALRCHCSTVPARSPCMLSSCAASPIVRSVCRCVALICPSHAAFSSLRRSTSPCAISNRCARRCRSASCARVAS
mmetsp:Transcript_28461/g.67344  ORF Transcript_28461/g.67344 Transcript_28461/m.67344 type:complete len:338 (-) Transcript_28461:74-1087(-)